MINTASNFEEIEQLLREAMALLSLHVSDKDKEDVLVYIDHGEYGVAYELLIFVIDKLNVPHPLVLQEAAHKMGLD